MSAQRLNFRDVSPEIYKVLSGVEVALRTSGLDPTLIELVKMRASQINGCAFCLDMHSKDARRHGESEQRLYLLNAWSESPLYTPKERAALAWTEALTRVAEQNAPDPLYEALRAHFSDKEIMDLTALIGMINLWNRLAIGMRSAHPVEPKNAG